MTEIHPFTWEPTVWIQQNAASKPDLSLAINPRFRSQPALSSSMQMNSATTPFSTPLPQAQPTVQGAASIIMNTKPTARASRRPLQRETSRPFVDPASLSPFLSTRIPLRELL